MKQYKIKKRLMWGGVFLLLSACLYAMSGCGNTVDNTTIPVHSHTYLSSWTSDETHHWHEATCEHRDEKAGYAAHTYNAANICTVCNHRKQQSGEQNTHTHTFSSEFQFDEINHWHKATCEHTGVKDAVTPHSFTEWAVVTAATCDTAGVSERHCTVCAYKEEKSIAKGHTYSNTYSYNETMHWRPAVCEHTEQRIGMALHTMGEWETVTPTCETEGKRVRTCTGCAYTESESLGYGTHSYSKEWTTSATHHWHMPTCSHTTEVQGKESHVFGEWVVLTPASCLNAGEQQRICKTCDYVEKDVVPKAEHRFAATLQRDGVNHWKETVCDIHEKLRVDVEAHTYGAETVKTPGTCQSAPVVTKTCTECHYIHEEAKDYFDANVHVYEEGFTTDENAHWHAAVCGHENAGVSEYGEHTYGEWVTTVAATCETPGVETAVCTVCQKEKTRETEPDPDNHPYETVLTQGVDTHYYLSSCSHELRKNEEEHMFGPEETTEPPTCTETGTKVQICYICAKPRYSDIPALGHSFDLTVKLYDETHHWYGASCEHKDAQYEKTTHSMGEWLIVTAPTCEADGKQQRGCMDCRYTEVEVLPATAEKHPYSDEWEANETHHWHKATCTHTEAVGDYGAHDYGESNESFVIETPATCGNEGLKRYICLDCGYREKTEVLPQLSHTFSKSWSSSKTEHWHAATCEHTELRDGLAAHDFGEWEILTDATCETTGSRRRICETCHAEQNETIPIAPEAHTFYADKWENDEAHHWNLTQCTHTNEKPNMAEHVYGDWGAPYQVDGQYRQMRSCMTCHYLEKRECTANGYPLS